MCLQERLGGALVGAHATRVNDQPCCPGADDDGLPLAGADDYDVQPIWTVQPGKGHRAKPTYRVSLRPTRRSGRSRRSGAAAGRAAVAPGTTPAPTDVSARG